jgi:hypothetical protein
MLERGLTNCGEANSSCAFNQAKEPEFAASKATLPDPLLVNIFNSTFQVKFAFNAARCV